MNTNNYISQLFFDYFVLLLTGNVVAFCNKGFYG